MPPRGTARGRDPASFSLVGRGGGSGRGGGPPHLLGRGAGVGASSAQGAASHVTTVGVRRSAFGTAGRPLAITTNHFPVKIPDSIIHHYDVIIRPDEKTLPARLNMEIIDRLQTKIAPQVFTPRAVYDGRKNLFAARELPFGEARSQEFDVTLEDAGASATGRAPKIYKVKLTHVAEINPEVLARFLQGTQSQDNMVLTAITALNVVIRMEPSLKYPFNVRSFFTNRETKDIGGGIVLWRGYFQSVRPAIGKMLINVDISTGAMYKDGPLLNVCLDFFSTRDPSFLAPSKRLRESDRIRLQRFVMGMRVTTRTAGQQQARAPRVVKRLSSAGANALSFTTREGNTITVAQYFRQTHNLELKCPDAVCAEVGNGALVPLEMLYVPPGQIMKKPIPPEKTKDVLEFATKKPHERLQSIANGLGVLQYGQSEYVRQFGLAVDPNAKPMSINARVLSPPTLKYGAAKQGGVTIVPRDGSWNMVDKKFYQPCKIQNWIVVVFERQGRFTPELLHGMIQSFVEACKSVGITMLNERPEYGYANPQVAANEQIRRVASQCVQKYKTGPNLVICVLPEGATDVYTAVKHFGDIEQGVATQCLKSDKCSRARPQYFANVCLKINVKLGGINTIPDPRSVAALTDPKNPTIVMGADVIHPAPGAEGRPSFTALVANVDSDTAKYVADCRVQTSRKELIEDLESMSQRMLEFYMDYRRQAEKKSNPAPTRIIFYRDGVSEGQFKHVIEQELPLIKKACANLKINPKITMIVVGKRHHVRFFPQGEKDKSGNCPAGTIVDRDVTHPLELDWYLQSHAGLLGTSRPAHYSVLHDENNFTPDNLQALSFALCHVYARSTRSVSIPAPVYYADIVCSRAKNHYNPMERLNFDESSGLSPEGGSAVASLDKFKEKFKPLHPNMRKYMYFS